MYQPKSTTTISQQGALAAQKGSCILGYVNKRMASRVREAIVLLYSALRRSNLESHIQAWATQYRKDAVRARPEEATEMTQRLEHLSYKDRLGKLQLLSLQKKRLLEEFPVVF